MMMAMDGWRVQYRVHAAQCRTHAEMDGSRARDDDVALPSRTYYIYSE